ncbi:MAG: glycoside hydrolase family 99-like domain-containing protein [Rhodocyclaceae bacterium]|nr:glycoside hydrolase family 99-like domain-containing protein [Rhodocyclaceae bacterium]
MNFQLVLIKPEGFEFVESFREVMEVLQEGLTTLGHTVTASTNQIEPNAWPVIFGAHHLDAASVNRLPAHSIIYNLEQLVPGYPWFSEAYLQLLTRFQVWDYSSLNVEYLRSLGRSLAVIHLPFAYSPCLSRITPVTDEDIDVLFFGVHTERRMLVLEAMAKRGLNVVCLRDVWGAQRDAWIARAKVVVAIRQTDNGVFENVRVIFLLANAKAVVSELLPDEQLPVPLQSALCAAPYDDLVDACERLVADADARAALRQNANAAIKTDALQALPWISRAVQSLSIPRFDEHLREQLYEVNPDYRDFETKAPLALPFERFAFYLPQFHRCPENDQHWGAGFTEWNNVSRALPRFAGHYQPRLPGELGYYDLAAEHVLQRQVDLAKNYGITGFMFFFYWLEGRPVLEKPIQDFFQRKTLDLKYYFMWANENWTRRWDGMEDEVLLRQTYSLEQTMAMVSHMIPYFKDDRYLKVGNRPVLAVYRVDLIPDIASHISIWSAACLAAGLDRPLLIMALSFANTDPYASGFDAAMEYPPHPSVRARTVVPTNICERLQSYDTGFNGSVFHYDAKVESELTLAPPPFRCYRTAFPSWDNSARRRKGGSWTFAHSSPKSFSRWLGHLCRQEAAQSDQLRMVCINAWNEWGEGAYLEPDARYGYAYLDAMYETFKRYPDVGGE